MDFSTALNVTIYGLGIVFLSLLVIMFVIMILSRLSAAMTGKDFLVANSKTSVKSEADEQEVTPSHYTQPTGSTPPVLVKPTPQFSSAPPPSVSNAPTSAFSVGKITAPLPGKVLSIAVQVGESVKQGQDLCVVEAMKMANNIKAKQDCTIKEVLVSAGDSVPFGAPLFVVE